MRFNCACPPTRSRHAINPTFCDVIFNPRGDSIARARARVRAIFRVIEFFRNFTVHFSHLRNVRVVTFGIADSLSLSFSFSSEKSSLARARVRNDDQWRHRAIPLGAGFKPRTIANAILRGEGGGGGRRAAARFLAGEIPFISGIAVPRSCQRANVPLSRASIDSAGPFLVPRARDAPIYIRIVGCPTLYLPAALVVLHRFAIYALAPACS